MTTKEQIEARIAVLKTELEQVGIDANNQVAQIKAQLEQVVGEANRQIGMRQGALAELQRMLDEID